MVFRFAKVSRKRFDRLKRFMRSCTQQFIQCHFCSFDWNTRLNKIEIHFLWHQPFDWAFAFEFMSFWNRQFGALKTELFEIQNKWTDLELWKIIFDLKKCLLRRFRWFLNRNSHRLWQQFNFVEFSQNKDLFIGISLKMTWNNYAVILATMNEPKSGNVFI